ncbi:hypothetical protein GLOTRDRAFT_93664 [Gloeophyllum trabeum ATCC 11539]|uniref:Uncharacterized protein n=1 Tax=Gloeophyllum trabeum (strain ATCC 11539 / FP-39264 / Madison 617) TaxID=670483 RepID=S7RQG3_GLOTA|nr:uncharacterized protein GLOTRDRAFT_93664 [Gloeophyllum trabeum ATCC 11539]EPQ55129.1 hypothetical protein GLOTRDRAFT_93664 [Gloeophyllum trabeum ATCC 11539]
MSALVLPAKWARKSNAEDLRQIICDHDSSADEEMEMEMEIAEGVSETASDILDTEIEYPSSDDDEHGEDMEIVDSGIQTENEVLGESLRSRAGINEHEVAQPGVASTSIGKGLIR